MEVLCKKGLDKPEDLAYRKITNCANRILVINEYRYLDKFRHGKVRLKKRLNGCNYGRNCSPLQYSCIKQGAV